MTETRRADHPFRFCTQVSLVELTGLKAASLSELRDHLRTVPGSVVYYHTHHFLKQHHFLSPEPPNDFAWWIAQALNDDRLSERLAAVDTVRFPTLRALREQLLALIETHMSREGPGLRAPAGEEFHFMKSRSFVIQTPYIVETLAEFIEAVKRVSIHSLYHHVFESRLRLERGTNDFSHWLEIELGEGALARAIARLDPYTQTLEGLRMKILRLAGWRAA